MILPGKDGRELKAQLVHLPALRHGYWAGIALLRVFVGRHCFPLLTGLTLIGFLVESRVGTSIDKPVSETQKNNCTI